MHMNESMCRCICINWQTLTVRLTVRIVKRVNIKCKYCNGLNTGRLAPHIY